MSEYDFVLVREEVETGTEFTPESIEHYSIMWVSVDQDGTRRPILNEPYTPTGESLSELKAEIAAMMTATDGPVYELRNGVLWEDLS